MSQQLHVQAWMYPGQPACSAMTEIADGRHIDILKPQYFRLADNGVLIEQDANDLSVGCNGYSPANVAAIKKYSSQQFVTISGTQTGMSALTSNSTLTSTFISVILSFLSQSGFTGIELDYEPLSGWTSAHYSAYKAFVTILGTALHTNGFKLMLDGPGVINTTYQGYYQWKYEDFNTLPVDYLVAMCYDFQYDRGCGTPVASLQDITDCCNWMKSKLIDPSRIVIGLNSYGYGGKTGTYTCTEYTYQQSTQLPGFTTATRDTSSGEMMWAQSGMSYNYSDSTTLLGKVQAVLATGLSNVSIWHIGGNQWFHLPVIQPQSTQDPILAAFSIAYPGFATWYAAHFDAEGNYHA